MSRRPGGGKPQNKGSSAPNVFLSYSRGDVAIARRLVNDLRSLGISIYFDMEVNPGEDFPVILAQLLSAADAVLVLISPHSLQSSWVKREWSQALGGPNKRIIPALVGGATLENLPFEFRRIQAIDLNYDYDSNLRLLYQALSDIGRSSEPSIADTIDVDHITNDVTARVLRQLGSRDESSGADDAAAIRDSRLIFVICAFHSDMEPAFEAIANAAATHGLRAERVKDVVGDYRITEKLLSMIRDALFIVADLSHERPNVYFELGYARGLGKKVVTILREGTPRHFDVYDWNYISYIDSRPLERALIVRFGQELSST